MFFYDVAVPEMALSNLIYQCPVEIKTGLRVIVEVRKHFHAGFVLGETKNSLPSDVKIKNIEAVIDKFPVISPDLWDMALYAGRVCLCGAAAALKVILPRYFIMGDKIENPPKNFDFDSGKFREKNFFTPFDSERFDFYLSELNPGERTLILFSQKDKAKKFFESLSDEMKNRALLWISTAGKKYLSSWFQIQEGKFDFVIGTAGAVFAPLMPQKIIIEDEASQNFFIPPVLNISARSLAGHRAAFLGAEFISGGRLPSLKTFIRTKPEEKILPKRKNIIFADIFHYQTLNGEQKGIKGSIPLTSSLLKKTYRELIKKNNVIWILDRLGEASEVFCSRCGETVKCPKCKNSMRAENDGRTLRCGICGTVCDLPPKCEKCGFEVLTGRRPGLEALEKIAKKYYDKVVIYKDKYSVIKKNNLIISTRRGLELCEKIHPSLIAWLDLDLELSHHGYNTQLEVFTMLWDSYWRGREKDSERKVLIQSRSAGMKLAKFFPKGWTKFFSQELAERMDFNLPPFGFIVELETQNTELREKILDSFFDAGIFVMDSGENEPLYINLKSLEPVWKILNSMKISARELKITVQN